MRQGLVRAIGGVAMMALIAGAAACNSSSKNTSSGNSNSKCGYELAFFGALTGSAADLGINIEHGAELAVDQYNQKLKAAGTFDIEAFDLANPTNPLVGKWHLDLDQSNAGWNSTLLEYTYGFILPFQSPPRHPDITIKVTFFDELTQTPFTNQKVVTITLPPETQPTTHP